MIHLLPCGCACNPFQLPSREATSVVRQIRLPAAEYRFHIKALACAGVMGTPSQVIVHIEEYVTSAWGWKFIGPVVIRLTW